MSRSYKHCNIIKENSRGSKVKEKKLFSHKMRRMLNNGLEIADGNQYKKIYRNKYSYFYDFKYKKTKKKAIEEYQRYSDPESIDYCPYILERYGSLNDYLRRWKSIYSNK